LEQPSAFGDPPPRSVQHPPTTPRISQPGCHNQVGIGRIHHQRSNGADLQVVEGLQGVFRPAITGQDAGLYHMQDLAPGGIASRVHHANGTRVLSRSHKPHFVPQLVRVSILYGVNDDHFAIARPVLQDRYERILELFVVRAQRNDDG